MTAIGNADKFCHHPFWILKNQYSLNIQVLKFTHDLNVSTDQMDFFFCLSFLLGFVHIDQIQLFSKCSCESRHLVV